MVANLLCGGEEMRDKKKSLRLEGASERTVIDDQYCSDTFLLYEIGWPISWTPVVGCPFISILASCIRAAETVSVSNESPNIALHNWNRSIYGAAIHKQNLFCKNQMDTLPGLYNAQSALNTNDNF
jgi:hypothetical protein